MASPRVGYGRAPVAPGSAMPARTVIAPGVYQGKQQILADALMQSRNAAQQGPQDIGAQVGQALNTIGTSYMAGANERAGQAERTAANDTAKAALAAALRGEPLDAGAIDAIGSEWVDPGYQQVIGTLLAQQMKPGDTDLVQAVGPDGQLTWVPKSQAAGMASALPKEPDAPNVQEFFKDGHRVKGYLDPQGNLVQVGDSAPLFAPERAPQQTPSDRAKRAQEAGLVPGTKEYQDFVLGSDQAAGAPKQENILRDEFNALTKDFRTVQDAYSKIESTSASGAGDMSMLYSYVKLLDPGSVVRESEFATAAASGSFGESVQGAVQRLATGERLPDSLRDAFKAEAKAIFAAQKAGYDRLKTSYGNLATRTGVPTENVIVDYAAPEAPPPLGVTPTAAGQEPVNAPQTGQPNPGDIQDGYRFKGGNPADPNSWEPVS